MIRDVGEDPLSPALRDIERERGGAGGQNSTRHTVVTPSLCGMLVSRRSAEGQKLPLRLRSRNKCYPSPIFKPSLGRRGDLPNCTSPLSAGLEREAFFLSRCTYKKFAFKIVESKSKLANHFSFLLKIYSALQNSQITVYFFCGREFVT